jgi:site-specific recombinase XerC
MRADLDAYTAYRAATDWSPATCRSAGQNLGLFLRWLTAQGVTCWADLTPAHLDAYQMDLLDRGLAYGTRINRVWLVRGLCAWLARRGRVLVDPARHLDATDTGDEPLPPAPLSEEQVTQLFDLLPRRDAVDLRTRLHVELLYGCALRLSESINLDVTDLDLAERSVLVRGGKGNKDRRVPMMRGVLLAAHDYLAVRRELLRGPDTGVLLLSDAGQRLEQRVIGRVLARLGRRIGAHIHPHLLRHSLAVHLLRRGVDIRIIQEILGHSSLDTTKVYLRLVPGHLREDYDKAMPPIAVEAAG